MPEPRLLKECIDAMERQYSTHPESRRARIKRGLTKQGLPKQPSKPRPTY